MKSSALLLSLVSAICLALLSIPANAVPALRTWVSGNGTDLNTCPRAQPCATFAYALTQTAAGGEIDVVDPGDFGPVTINKSISIYNDGVGEAGILATANTTAITINAAATDVVNLRGLVLNGLGVPAGGQSFDGITINRAGRVTIQNCVIQQFGTPGQGEAGIFIGPNDSIAVKIQDTTIINNTDAGVVIESFAGAAVYVSIEHSRIDNNRGNGVSINNIFAGAGAVLLSISDSSMSVNAGAGLLVASGQGNAKVNAQRDVFGTNGGFGVEANQQSGGNASVIVGNSIFADDLSGAIGLFAGGTVYTLGNNQLSGPGGNGSPTPLSAF
jgi:hypothetical protein